MKKYELIMWIALLLAGAEGATLTHNAVETEMFAVPVSPNVFNWTYQEFDKQYRFHCALVGKPELPSWLKYIYSERHHSGFIFGTPPTGVKSPITLEVIGLNRQDYETRRILLTLKVEAKEKMALHEVEMKIDNLNVEDLLDEHRMTRLKEIFRTKLWPESSKDLYATFLASAIDLGARLPLKPNEGEGLVVRLGSSQPFSTELKRVREEVRPLSKLPSCPREYKRTTVERIFREHAFTLDWCHFELYNTIYTTRGTERLEYLAEMPDQGKMEKANLQRRMNEDVPWHAPRKHELPSRSYVREVTAAAAVPLVLMLVSVTALTALLCFHYSGVSNTESQQFVANIFHICIDRRKRALKVSKVEQCRYEGNSEQTQVADNGSDRSVGVSPNNSLPRPYSPKSSTNLAGSYNRPQPPPYIGSTLHNRKSNNSTTDTWKSTKSDISTEMATPEHRGHLALEESIKLLNEAQIVMPKSILKEPVIDFCDGADDYVPIKGDGYFKADLDDIDVPELSKYGLGGVSEAI